jgi:formylmethanofuran--tetrahydromethanopterin N-formyltransferase
MDYHGVTIEDTYCECTDVYIARLLLTAISSSVALHEAAYLCGWSIITAVPIQGCVEGIVSPAATPDGRPGMLIQLNAPTLVGLDAFCRAVLERLYILPHLPTCSIFDATPAGKAEHWIAAAAHVGRWGDGFERDVNVGGREALCLPIMTGDQIIERRVGVCVGTDGVIEVFAENAASCLIGAQEATTRVVRDFPGVAVFNYPVGGISGAKVGGTTYTEEGVTINEPFCPSLRGMVETKLPADADAVIEFPLVAVSESAIRAGLRTAIGAFSGTPGILEITAPSFGGTWGGRRLMLREILEDTG